MEKAYNAKNEKEIYQAWESKGYFTPKIDKTKKPFVIATPPPNITGDLHLGHVTPMTIIDIYARYHRMKNIPTLVIPGTDHAAIAAQNVVERKLKKEKKLTRHDLGKEKFLTEMWKFIKEYKPRIENQIRKIGVSCDWTRNHFTMDPDLTKAVEKVFKKLKKDKLIYKGERIINWCIRCQTALSDLENIYREESGKLYYIKYKISARSARALSCHIRYNKLKNNNKFITVATTRPETMLGDTAVAVNPDDARYKGLIGQKVILPLMNREIPVIADKRVDKDFGTGALKVTPAHDENDFQISQDHNLEKIKVINEIGKIAIKPCQDLKIMQAREKIIQDLKDQKLLVKTEDISHSIGHCERCDTITEPLLSKQYFVSMKQLAQPAIQAVRSGKIKIIPKRAEKIYFNWLENIQDWCISRQIWWGHELPGTDFTLDTWFSSALWPFSTLGWPEKTKDLEYFYPTNLMITAQDILFFWVARMIMMGIYCTGKIPFSTIYLNQLILDQHGQKMSKSKGNVLDPLLYIDKYGTDAVRLSIIIGAQPGGRQRLGEEKIKGLRNFVNKLWNIGRFIKFQISNDKFSIKTKCQILNVKTDADKWILSKLQMLIKSTDLNLKKYRISQAGQDLYDFTWHDFADWYIEIAKCKMQNAKLNSKLKIETMQILHYLFFTLLRLLHPFVPFVTEQLWQEFEQKDMLIISNWPEVDENLISQKAEKDFEKIREKIGIKEYLESIK